MTKVRDTQKTSVYEAEALVRRMFDLADERGLRTVEVAGPTSPCPSNDVSHRSTPRSSTSTRCLP